MRLLLWFFEENSRFKKVNFWSRVFFLSRYSLSLLIYYTLLYFITVAERLYMNKYNLQYNFLSSAWSIIYLLLLLLQCGRTSTSIVVQRETVKNFLLVNIMRNYERMSRKVHLSMYWRLVIFVPLTAEIQSNCQLFFTEMKLKNRKTDYAMILLLLYFL